MTKTQKNAVAGLLGTLIALMLAWAATDRLAAAKLDDYDARWRKAVADERALAATGVVPVLRGVPIDEDARAREEALFVAHPFDVTEYALVSSAVDAGPLEPIRPDVLALLEKRRAALAGLREAVRCTRCVARPDYEGGPEAQVLDVVAVRGLVNLLLLEGHADALEGDLASAAAHDLDATRIGIDLALNEPRYGVGLGTAVCERALVALGRLVVRAPAGSLPLDAIERELDLLEPSLPSARTALRCERLLLGSWRRLESEDRLFATLAVSLTDLTLADRLLPTRRMVARAIDESEALLEELLRAATTDDPAERATLEAAIDERAGQSPNLLVRVFVSRCAGLRTITDRAVARLRLVRGAIAVERSRGADGLYPATLDALPRDPFAKGPLRYQPAADRKGYELASAGAEDPMIERVPLALERKP